MSLRSRTGGKSTAGLRRTDDGPLIRSEYSDEILYRNQREDRKLESACRYLDRASRVVSNELAQQKTAIVRSLARIRRVTELSTGSLTMCRKANAEEAAEEANPNRRYVNGHSSRAEEANSGGGGSAVTKSSAKSACGPSPYQANRVKGSDVASHPVVTSFRSVAEKTRIEGRCSTARNGSCKASSAATFHPVPTFNRRNVQRKTD